MLVAMDLDNDSISSSSSSSSRNTKSLCETVSMLGMIVATRIDSNDNGDSNHSITHRCCLLLVLVMMVVKNVPAVTEAAAAAAATVTAVGFANSVKHTTVMTRLSAIGAMNIAACRWMVKGRTVQT